MVFASPIFLFAFLPLALALYFATPNRARNFTLLCLSLVFYTWGEHEWVLAMLASTVFNWLGAIAVERLTTPKAKQRLLAALISVNLGALAVFKYSGFAIENLSLLSGLFGGPLLHPVNLHLPLGISFFTFHAISYVVDVYRGQSRALRNPLDTALYIALFPQLIAGPIIRYHYIEEQLKKRRPSLSDMAYGTQRFVLGLAKKVLIANVLARCADAVFDAPLDHVGLGSAWAGVLAYALQIYFDFSGYSDMAIGLGSMFGFRFPENFNHPYASQSITDFWRRWHISLSSWFRDYLYIPLGGNRGSTARTYLNLVTVFLLCGLWHGASFNFLIWGALHGAFLGLERAGYGAALNAAPRTLRHLSTLLVVCVGWVFFRAADLSSAIGFLRALVGAGGISHAGYPVALVVTPAVVLAGVLGALFSTPLPARLRARFAQDGSPLVWLWPALSIGSLLALFVISAAFLATRTYNPFIYFRF